MRFFVFWLWTKVGDFHSREAAQHYINAFPRPEQFTIKEG
jgi:hypothetical protein